MSGADGSNQTQVTHLGVTRLSGSPTVVTRTDEDDCVRLENAEGQTEIYTVSAEGGPARRLTDHPGFDAVPTWSRDGRSIYFTSERSGSLQLWKMPAEGGTPVQITKHGGVNAMESADGRTLYYAKGIDCLGDVEDAHRRRRGSPGARRSCRTGDGGTWP